MKILILGGVGVGAGVSGWRRRVEWQFNCRIVPGGWLILLIIVEKSESVQKQNSICDCTLFSITPFKMTSENFLWPVSKIAFFHNFPSQPSLSAKTLGILYASYSVHYSPKYFLSKPLSDFL